MSECVVNVRDMASGIMRVGVRGAAFPRSCQPPPGPRKEPPPDRGREYPARPDAIGVLVNRDGGKAESVVEW